MLRESDNLWSGPPRVARRAGGMGGAEAEAEAGLWQRDARLASVLELVFWWLEGAELARAAAACGAWRAAAGQARAWRWLLRARAPKPRAADDALRALALQYGGACPWREVFVAAAAPWRLRARVAPAPRARLAAAALSRDGARLALAADDGAVSVWRRAAGGWRPAGAGSVAALRWAGVARAEWAPAPAARLLLAGPQPLAASRGALAVLEPCCGAEGEAWRVAARAGGAGGCWAGADGFLSLELVRLSAPDQPPHFATDVWLNAASQETESEFAGVAARVLRVYNEEPALITQVVCAETPLDARAAQEWAEAEAEANADWDEETERPGGEAREVPVEEQLPNEAYYRATYEGAGGDEAAWVRLAVLACGARLLAAPLPAGAPPPLRVRAALADRVAARSLRRAQEAAAVAAEQPPAPAPTPGELRARCAAPAARLRLPARVLGLAVHNNGRCVWAALAGGAACAGLPALRPLRRVPLAPHPAHPAPRLASDHYVQPDARDEYFGSPVGAGSGVARVWGAAWGAGALLPHAAPALALLLPPAAPAAPAAPPQALVLTEDALHVWECVAPRAPPPAGSPR